LLTCYIYSVDLGYSFRSAPDAMDSDRSSRLVSRAIFLFDKHGLADAFLAVIGIIPCIVLSIWTSHPDSTPLAAAYASYFISFLCLGTAPLIFAWLSDL